MVAHNSLLRDASRFDPWLLAEVERGRAAASERRRLQTLTHVVHATRVCLACWPSVQAWIFGSLVRPGCFTRSSDIDLAVLGLARTEYFALLGKLEEALKTSRIDLLELERCSFAGLIRQMGVPIQ